MEQIPEFLFIDHIAICVAPGALEAQIAAYAAMGFREVHREEILGGDQVREVMLQIGEGPNSIQLLEPLTPESPVTRQLEKNGGRAAVAHIAFRVADIDVAFVQLKKRGYHILDAAPRAGARGTRIFFVHPQTSEAAALGYLLEVVGESSRA